MCCLYLLCFSLILGISLIVYRSFLQFASSVQSFCVNAMGFALIMGPYIHRSHEYWHRPPLPKLVIRIALVTKMNNTCCSTYGNLCFFYLRVCVSGCIPVRIRSYIVFDYCIPSHSKLKVLCYDHMVYSFWWVDDMCILDDFCVRTQPQSLALQKRIFKISSHRKLVRIFLIRLVTLAMCRLHIFT